MMAIRCVGPVVELSTCPPPSDLCTDSVEATTAMRALVTEGVSEAQLHFLSLGDGMKFMT